MAEREETKRYQDEKKIPVFTVLKNGVILKNIFIVNNDPPSLASQSNRITSFLNEEFKDQEIEDVTTLGRHPDCNIMLTHPSISRFHLQIHSIPSSEKLFVVDLSSVHGTWVSEKRIEPGVRVEMRDGDTLRVGGSSRVYRLHWVPLSCAYDFETPPMSTMEVASREKKENADAITDENCKENSLLDGSKETGLEEEDSVLSNIDPLYHPNENWNIDMIKEISSAPPFAEVEAIVTDDSKNNNHSRNEFELKETNMLKKNLDFGNQFENLMVDDRKPGAASGKELSEYANESLQPHSQPLSAENFSFNVEDVIMSSFFGGERNSPRDLFEKKESCWFRTIPFGNESISFSTVDDGKPVSVNGSQPFNDENESLKLDSPLCSEENWSLDVNDMSSFFGEESKSLSRKKYDQKETCNIQTIQAAYESKNLCTVDDGNQELEPHSIPLSEGKLSSDIEDIAICSFDGDEDSLRNEFELKKNRSVRNIPFGNESSNLAMAEDGRPISEKESEEIGNKNEQPNSLSLPAENLSMNVGVLKESESLKCSLSLQSQTTEKTAFIEDHSSTTKEVPNKSHAKIEEVHEDEVSRNLFEGEQLTESLLSTQSVYQNERSENSTSDGKLNLPDHNVVCCIEDKCIVGFEKLEPTDDLLKKDYEQNELPNLSFVPCEMELVNSNLPYEEVTSEITVKIESQTPNFSPASVKLKETQILEASPERSENDKSAMGSIWSRRGKPASFPRIKTGVNVESRKENAISSDLGREEEEIFTPDKENFAPNTHSMKSLKKKSNTEKSRNSKPCRSQSSIFKSSPVINKEELSQGSDKENQTPKVLQERKLERHISKNRIRLQKEKTFTNKGAEREPFQLLQLKLTGNGRSGSSVANSTTKSNISSVNCTGALKNNYTEEKKHWTMVVDINSLLNKDSMKSLKLLQGLKGTHLVVPRTVIRELDCMRRHGSFFRRTTEVSSALQWIEDCLVKTEWWIHVQSSVEGDRGLTAPTPPVTPQSQYKEGSEGLFCRRGSSIPSFKEILSPTAEDHILDCALQFRKMDNRQIVLLSEDLTLKIKAMAEGLICETAKEFRESLVNPFSERFLWADSSPRGLTWSCSDDVVLKERYDRCSLRSSKGEGVKGLKLILLHNSHYIRSASSG